MLIFCQVERRHARATLIVDNQDMKAQQELLQKRQTQQNLITYEDGFRRIREATHVTDMDEVVERVLSQREKQDALKAQVADLESQRQRMRTELERLFQNFHDMKYSGEKEMSRWDEVVERVVMLLVYGIGLLPDTFNCGLRMRRVGNVFPAIDFKGNR